MKNTELINSILTDQNKKINAFMLSGKKTHFFYAYYPSDAPWEEELKNVHMQGFDNYPIWMPKKVNMTFFWERVLGCKTENIDGKKDFFHTFCVPLENIDNITSRLDSNGVWHSYLEKVLEYVRQKDECEMPIATPGINLLDCACGICGTERLFTLMYDDEYATEKFFYGLTEVYLESIKQLKNTGIKLSNPYGFPGVYCNDLQMPYLAPAMIKRYILPCYKRIALETGGLILAINCPDLQIAEEILKMEGVIGASFYRGIPIFEIKRILIGKMFVINNYTYYNHLDKPTLLNGIYCNPIVHTYSRELFDVWRELSADCSILVTIERHKLCQAANVRNILVKLQSGGNI